ncbi:uncharacterized protein SETTUDRAFT_30869 [Exserohilum turcica Et28A]|uniref:DUF7514 domain-containing protein n=1 Tax=Exserohilum turcicum (strain 28A) TaxID=671987 RepID=R0IP69_EXST2|nr:uncharacterized protein SETTUDRAFT_30869 [Exserohilum turcica Et28A]EOA86536.1 hypothetical protein SETTUDRAFT_30869 [Exserohilum turcica Et28A]
MAPEPTEQQDHQEEQAANATNADAAHREAYDYWGYLLKEDKCGTPKLDRLLKGIADVISHKFEPNDSPDLTPSQIAAWYRSVGGDYDVLFMETPPSSIAFIYRSLGAFHSLQPAADDDGYSSPTIPALKKQGFVTWQTIQLLLGPEEHVPFLQRAVELDDIPDPETGTFFPKILPKECFPDRPDDAMEAWYQNVAARLKKEAEEEASQGSADEPRLRNSADYEASSADEKHGAYRYFEDPLYRSGRPRPTFMRHVMKQPPRVLDDRGRAVTSRVRHMLNPLNPFASKKRMVPGRHESDSYSDEDATPMAAPPQTAPRYRVHKRPSPLRREPSLSTTDLDSDSDPDHSPRRRTPILRTHRSHEAPIAQQGYFPAHQEARRYSNQHDSLRPDGRSSTATSPQPAYRPTTSPLFATQVAQAQQEARKYYDRRPAMPPRTSYRPVPAPHGGVRWSGPGVHLVSPPRDAEPAYTRERDHHREREGLDPGVGSSGRSHRRHSEDVEYPRERERERERDSRTRSHDRARDDWDDVDYVHSRNGSRERERERERHRDPRVHSVRGQIVRLLKDL